MTFRVSVREWLFTFSAHSSNLYGLVSRFSVSAFDVIISYKRESSAKIQLTVKSRVVL